MRVVGDRCARHTLTFTKGKSEGIAGISDDETARSGLSFLFCNLAPFLAETRLAGAAVRLLVSRLDRSLVDGTLNHVNTQTLPALDAQIQGNGAAMQRTLDTTTNVMGSLNAQIWNPKLGNSITQLSIASTQLAQASTHANKILGDGEKVADHYEKEILAPVSWYRKAAEYVLSFGADARVLFGSK